MVLYTIQNLLPAGTIDGGSQNEYRRALTNYIARGIKPKDLDAAIAASVDSGGIMSYMSGLDEQSLDLGKLDKILAPLLKK